MKILMLNPPFLPKFSRTSRSPAVSKGGCIYYPIWLAYATGVLEKVGHEVRLVDAPAQNLELKDVLKTTANFNPDMIVLDTSTPSIDNDVKVLEAVRDACEDCFSVLVGTHASALPRKTMKMSEKINAVAFREYDYTLRELAEELEKNKGNFAGAELEKIKGLVFRKRVEGGRKKKAEIVENAERELIEELDEIPFVSEVYKRHLNIRDYFYPANFYPEITIVTGRGCPYQCTYCVLPQVFTGRGYRKRSVENVLAEFKYIKENFPDVKEIFIEDDTFTADPARVNEFCGLLVEEGLELTWSANARADVGLETLQKMKKAGCRLLCVGFESGSQEILNNIKKGTRIDVIRQFMKDTKKAGIMVHGCFMLGNKGETKETIRETVDFAKELNPDTAQFFPIMVYPGTEAYDYFKKQGFLISEKYEKWLNAEGCHNCMVSRPGLSNSELVELCDEARREFYLRKNYVFKKMKQAITEPKEIPRLVKGTRNFYRHILRKQ